MPQDRYIPGGMAAPRPVGQQPGQSYTPGQGMGLSRMGMQRGGNNVDSLKRQLAQLMSDAAMAQAMGKSPRHLADIQGKIYKLQLEIQLAQEAESGTASWLGDMMSASSQYGTSDPRYGR